MNLPITTLEDAWGEPKIVVNKKINRYKNEQEQTNILSKTNFDNKMGHSDNVYQGENILSTQNMKILGEKFNSLMSTTTGNNSTGTGVGGHDEHNDYYHQTVHYGSSVSITDPEVTRYLDRFNEEYKTNLINRILKKHMESPEIETYVSRMNDFEMYMLLLFLCFMLYEKLISIIKN
jgi:hypothetical protein